MKALQKKPTRFSLLASYAHSVALAGNFNEWNIASHPLTKDERGIWRIEIYLATGKYEYKFMVDQEWKIDPECVLFVATPEGTVNCVKVVE